MLKHKYKQSTSILQFYSKTSAKLSISSDIVWCSVNKNNPKYAEAATRGVFRNFAKFTGKHLCQSLFYNKVAGLRTTTLLQKRPWHKCFPINFAKFLRTAFLQNISGQLLLSMGSINMEKNGLFLATLRNLVLLHQKYEYPILQPLYSFC